MRAGGRVVTQGDQSDIAPSMHDITERLITAIDELSEKGGARLLLVSVPMGAEKRKRLQDIAAEKGIPYLQLDEHFQSQGSPVTFPHDVHWNVNGHAVAANAIDDFLAGQGVVGET